MLMHFRARRIFLIVLIIILSPLIILSAILYYRFSQANRLARLECVASRVFINVDQRGLETVLALRESPENRGKLLVETPRPQWSFDATNGSIARAAFPVLFRGRRIYEVRDVAVSPENIITKLGLEQRGFSFHCLDRISGRMADLVFAR
jgi:hypothetical protein